MHFYIQPLCQLMRQRHSVGRYHKATDVRPLAMLPGSQHPTDLFGKQGWPQPFDGGQSAEVFTLLGPGWLFGRHFRPQGAQKAILGQEDRKSTRLNSSHVRISYAVFCLKKKNALRFWVSDLAAGTIVFVLQLP